MNSKLTYVEVKENSACIITKQYVTVTPSLSRVLNLMYGKKGIMIERHMTVKNLKALCETLISWADNTEPEVIVEMQKRILPRLQEWDDGGRLLLFD